MEVMIRNRKVTNSITMVIGDESKRNLLDNFVKVGINPQFLFKTPEEEIYNYLKKNKKRNLIVRTNDTLKLIGFTDKKDKEIFQLSSGEKYLLEIGKILSLNPSTIIFDDIFYNLDLFARDMLFRLIKKMKDRYSKTIIIITNSVDLIYPICSNVLFMKNDKLLKCFSREEFINNYDYLCSNDIDIPNIVKFIKTSFVLKNIKLYNRLEVKDLIKDIYRSKGW